ncbi:MAG TPA: peroxiredoxin [Gammaproteobacteria bacterium]|nr:peroxiredoxin [Gammaproteobacteria bacterium]
MKRMIFVVTLIAAIAAPAAFASLPVGSKAPLFTAAATLGGKVYSFSLAEALKKGPVVLYFYPAAFTKGCTIEAHDFAAAIGKYQALDATVIGVSHDQVAVLQKFSVSECRSKFPVAADTDHRIMRAYDAVLPQNAEYANRTSYVIVPDGTIIYTYTNLNPDQHVANTLAALRNWEATHK